MRIREQTPRQSAGRKRDRRALPLLASAALTVTLGVPAALTSAAGIAQANGVPQPVDCPTATPLGAVVEGANGTGWTVSHGSAPESFSATVIGRIEDGIAPGVDLIIARVSSPALTAAGGVWSGISGSPVYADDGTLIGSVSYALGHNSMIAGLTPAAALMTLLDADPDDPVSSARPTVSVPKAALPKLLASGSVDAAEASQGFTRLPVPFTVGSVSATGASRWAKRLASRTGVPVLTGARASVTVAAPADSIVGGSNFAAMASYGYVSLGAVGTTTFTCQGRAVAFGHPFLDGGVNSFSLQAASTVTVADDINGAYKVVNFGGVAGTVDRDRTVGLRAIVGTPPANPTVILSSMTRAQTGAHTGGTTYAVTRDLVADAAALHALANVDKVMGSASATGTFTGTLAIGGTRGDGSPFTLSLGNTFAAASTRSFPLDYAVGDWVYNTLSTLLNQEFEDVTISQVSLTGTASSSLVSWRKPILRAFQGGKYVDPATHVLTATAGKPYAWLAGVTKFRGSSTELRRTTLTPPASAKGTAALISATTSDTYTSPGPEDFSELLASLANEPRNDEIRLELRSPDTNSRIAATTLRFSGVISPLDQSFRVTIR